MKVCESIGSSYLFAQGIYMMVVKLSSFESKVTPFFLT